MALHAPARRRDDDSAAQPAPVSARLDDLLAEMQALMQVLPAARADEVAHRAEIVAREAEDMVEAGFDNMPV